MIHTIKVKGCFDCPFRDMENEECEILNPFVEHDPWHNVSLLEVKFGEFHEKCPLNQSKIEIVKDNE